MADLKFDAVICGGGNKALMLAMYLTRYAGMSCAIFERRHEVGGGLATEEMSAPGFRGNTHANILLPWYYAPIYRDFPDFWEWGAQIDQYRCSDGSIFLDDETCLGIYSQKTDPTQEKTAREIARFSEKDAETWLRITKLSQMDEFQRLTLDSLLNPHEWQVRPEFLQRQAAALPLLEEAGLDPIPYLTASPLEAVKMLFESPELQYTVLRFFPSGVFNVRDKTKGMNVLGMAGTLTTLGYARGGTHMIAHACHQILVREGCKFFTHAEVTKVLHGGDTATGIELADGTQVEATKAGRECRAQRLAVVGDRGERGVRGRDLSEGRRPLDQQHRQHHVVQLRAARSAEVQSRGVQSGYPRDVLAGPGAVFRRRTHRQRV